MPATACAPLEAATWQPPDWQQNLRCRALAGVLRGAQEGELPLFTWTLGLPQNQLLPTLSSAFPQAPDLLPLQADQYARLLNLVPERFHALHELLSAHHDRARREPSGHWLPRVVAAACFGERHLWQDLGLSDREQVRTLFLTEFPSLGLRNTRGLRWKRFIFLELGARLGLPELLPPGCRRCDAQEACLGPTST